MALLEVKGLRASYGRTQVLHGIDLEIRAGEFLALMGPSGSGKTTLLNLIGGIDRADEGDLLVAGDYVQTSTTAAGASYTNRVITAPDGNILEDRTVTAAGSYSATASLSGSGGWVMQLVAFRAAGAGDTQPPTVPSGLAATAVSSSHAV